MKKMIKQFVSKKKIETYWNTRTPQKWYSDKKEELTFFNELSYKRYNIYYKYLGTHAEFEYHQGEKVLEVGVGMGTDLASYAKNKSIVSGIDLSPNAITFTKKQFESLGLEAEKLVIGDAENLPFEENYFDLVYSFGVLHHTPDIEKAVEEILRVLKPDGKFIVMLYRKGWKHYVKRIFINGLLKGQLFKHGYNKTVNMNTEVEGNSPLTYVFSQNTIKKIFIEASDVKITKHRLGEYFDYAPYETFKFPNFIVRLLYLFGLENLFGENYIIKGYKKNKDEKKIKISSWEVLTDVYKSYK